MTIDRKRFVVTTLSQGPHVNVEGTWRLSDRTIIFRAASPSEPALDAQSHSDEILDLSNRKMDTVNAAGEKKTLFREMWVRRPTYPC